MQQVSALNDRLPCLHPIAFNPVAMKSMAARIGWGIAILAALVAATIVLVRTARPSLDALAAIDISWTLVVAASVVWYLAFGLLAANWASSLRWWRQQMRVEGALHVFFVSNLARYIPGAVWQLAGLAAMSTARGVSPLAATAGVLIQQLVLLLTGAIIAIVAAPRLLGAWTDGFHPAVLVSAALVGMALLVLALPGLLRRVQPLLERKLGGRLTLPSLSKRDLAAYVARTVVAWIVYGIAFWLLGRGMFGQSAPSAFDAATAYIGASVLGIAAVFAPGGIIVREVAIAGALAPAMGLERATILAIGARIWMIALEIVGALVMLGLARLRPASAAPSRTDTGAAG